MTCLPSFISFDQLSQVCGPLGPADPGMFEKFLGTGSLFGFLAQTKVDKVLESLAEIALELWRRVLWNEEKDFHGMNVGIWGFSIGQLESSDTKRPDVSLVIISRLLDDFWSHPERGSNECVLLGHGGRELARNTKIGKLDLPIRAKQDVCSFDVSVELVVVVQVFQTHEQLSDDNDDIILGNTARSHEVTTATARAVFHNDPQVGALEV